VSGSYHTKYRPDRLEDVVGQGAIVKSLAGVVERDQSHAFLFCGPSGTGKTTLARIVAAMVGCQEKDVLDVNAATHTGIDAMRAVQEPLQYKPFGKAQSKAVVVDECHRLSGNAWDSLLKNVEEPQSYVYWFFCTTEPGKVPATIKTRCSSFTLKLVNDQDIGKLLDRVTKAEKIKLVSSVKDLVIKEAGGSPRQALVNLALVQDVDDRREAAEILKSAHSSEPVRELCQFVAQGRGSWAKAMVIISKLEDENPESIRIVVCNYIGAALKNAKSDKDACFFLGILDNFAGPYNSSEGLAPLLSAIGRTLFANGSN
jgi:DNA polymerase III gamma/tau subunit